MHVIHDPPPGRPPTVEIVFFHGFQFETTQEPYLKTWLSKDGTQLWLNWILNEFPDARIFVISYDAAFRRTNADGIAEMYITGENLVISLVDAEIGQRQCPVLLVGHCVGGLVMKEICIQARSFLPLHSSYRRVQNFLRSIKGLFYYATPNLGTEVAEISTHFAKGPLVEGLSILNKEAARRNHNFSLLRKEYGWEAFGVAEGLEVTLVSVACLALNYTKCDCRSIQVSYYDPTEVNFGTELLLVCLSYRKNSTRCCSIELHLSEI